MTKAPTEVEKSEVWPELRELTDAVCLVCVFKNESEDGLTIQLPKKAIEGLESAVRRFQPKMWEYIEKERVNYLKFVASKIDAPPSELEQRVAQKNGLFGKLFGTKKA